MLLFWRFCVWCFDSKVQWKCSKSSLSQRGFFFFQSSFFVSHKQTQENVLFSFFFFFFSILHQLLIIFMLFFCAPFLGLSTLRVHRNWMKPFAPSVRSCKAVTVRTCCAVKQTRCYESLVSSLSLNRDGNSAGYREKLQRRTCKMGREMLSSHFEADSWLDFPSVNSSGNAPWLVQSWQITRRLGLWTLTYSFI